MLEKQSHILIVDDEPYSLFLLKELLSDQFVVHTAHDGSWALEFLRSGGRAELVVSDIMMPNMDGFELCRRLKSNPDTRDIPVLLLTHDDRSSAEEKGLFYGAEDFIHKPFSPPVVLARVHNQLRLSHTTRRLRQSKAELEQLVAKRTAEVHLADCVIRNSREGAMVTDRDGVILSVNPAFTAITGYGAEEVLGRKPSVLRSQHHGADFYRDMWTRLLQDGKWEGELWNRRKNGEAYLQWLIIEAVDDDAGQPLRYVGVFSDLTELRRKDAHIRHLAYHDVLTGLPNRVLLEDRLQRGVSIAREKQQRLGLLLINIDRFKAVNDGLGHNVGDILLQEIALRIGACLRTTDTLGRLGGDEYVVITDGDEVAVDCAVLGDRILAALDDDLPALGHAIRVGASVGIALFPDDGADVVDLMKSADAAMYAAKAAGGGTCRFFQPAMTTRALAGLKLEMELRHAIARSQLELHYQPKVGADTHELRGFEALLRWRHPELGSVSPADFIPIAEESGQIIAIGDWVLDEACRQIAAWRIGGGGPVNVAVNVSAKQLQAGHLPERIEAAIGRHGIPPAALEVELTESVVMRDPQYAAEIFYRLKAIGVTVAIDDFGTGYSSLAYLRRLPIDVLKIDRSFIMDADQNEEDAQVVKTVLALGKALRLTVVAEGVETLAQAELLRESGCHLLQGFLFSRPLPADEIAAHWLAPAADSAACKVSCSGGALTDD